MRAGLRASVLMSASRSSAAPAVTVALDLPSARLLADQATIIADLQFVMDCCKQLLALISY